jgi:hypothetical protein
MREVKQPSEKGVESQNYFMAQIEQFERIESSFNLGLKLNGKFK